MILPRPLLLLAIMAASGACSSGVTPQFPTPLPAEQSATISVARAYNIVGAAVNAGVTLDGFSIAKLLQGQYVTFSVEPGVHAVGPAGATISLQFEAGQAYFFWLTPGGAGWKVERLQPEDARARMADFQDLTPK